MAPHCDVYVEDSALSGMVNMDRDAALLDLTSQDGSCSMVRIYRWEEPTVSLGYFQKTDAEVDSRLLACPRVRRISGGGAILHDNELTYSCALPAAHPLCRDPLQLYSVIHTAVIQLLARCGADCLMRMHSAPLVSFDSRSDPFLCFLRSDPRDVLLHGTKILGSAQRRRRGTILQHGSILLRASALTPEIVGVGELCPEFDFDSFGRELPQTVASAIAEDLRFCAWPPDKSASK